MFGVPSSLDQTLVHRPLVGRVEAGDRGGQLAADVRNSLHHGLAPVGVAAVAQLDRLVHPGRGARGNGGATAGARLELDVDLDGRVAARVEDLAAADGDDGGLHSVSLARSK